MQWLFSFAWSESQLKKNKKKTWHSTHPTKIRGSWNFGILGYGALSKYFSFQEIILWGGIFRWGRSVHSPSIFSFWNTRFKKIKKKKNFGCRTLTFKIPIFRFKTDAGLEADIDLTLNLNFLFQGAVSFHPSAGVQNQPNHETGFFFIHLVGLEGPPNPPVSKARAFRVNVNKHGSCQSKSKMIFL